MAVMLTGVQVSTTDALVSRIERQDPNASPVRMAALFCNAKRSLEPLPEGWETRCVVDSAMHRCDVRLKEGHRRSSPSWLAWGCVIAAVMAGVALGCGDDGVDLPAAGRPELVSVLGRDGSAATERNDGAFEALPARAVPMRVRAAWPANLDISLDTGETLASVPADDPQRASELDQQDIGHWSTQAIDVGTTPATWTVTVAPPRTRRLNSQRIGVLIRSVSLDQSLPPERRISEPLTVVLARSDGPRSGTLFVSFVPEDRQSAASAWVADLGALTGSLPRAAAIETVRNESSLTRTGNLGDERDDTALRELTYTVDGQTRSTSLAARQTSSAFAGLRTTGRLRATRPAGEALCIPLGDGPRRGSPNQAPCGRPDVGLWVDWRTP
jgi:hypothetical protein